MHVHRYYLHVSCSACLSLSPAQAAVPRGRCSSSKPVLCRSSSSNKSSRTAVEDVLSELQRLSSAKQQPQQQGQQKHLELNRLLAKASSRIASMSVGQLCRLASILACHQQDGTAANIKPLWQAVLRRLLHNTGQGKHMQQQQQQLDSPAAQESSSSSSSDTVSSPSTSSSRAARPQPLVPHPQLHALLQSQATAGEVLYLLRALASWREGADGLQAFGSSDSQAAGRVNIIAAVVAAASDKAGTMTLRDLLLSATALAQLTFYDPRIFITASSAFVQAVAAADSSTTTDTTSDTNSSSKRPQQRRQQHRQQQQQELLPHIRDHQLIINYLWANASIGHADVLLLQAALQLLLSRGLVKGISQSHLALCMWALAALLVCQLHHHHHQQQLCEQGQQQQQQQLVQAVEAVHSMLAAHACQLWQQAVSCHSSVARNVTHSGRVAQPGQQQQPSTATRHASGHSTARSSKGQQQQQQQQGSHKGMHSRAAAFSIDSRRQMYQSHVWIAAAVAATARAAGDSSTLVPRPEAAAVEEVSTLWPAAQLLAIAQQQQQQQDAAQAQQQQQQSDFWRHCGEAWSGHTTQVSALQREVYQALQAAGLQATLELPAAQLPQQQLQDTTAVQLPLEQQLQDETAAEQQLLKLSAQQQLQDLAAAEQAPNAEVGRAGLLSVDIACVMPTGVLQSAQQHGLKAALSELQQRHARTETAGLTASGSSQSTTTSTDNATSKNTTSGSNNTSSSSSSSDSTGGSCDGSAGVLVAIEVDGPTHVSAGCASHLLGATVCRNWLLAQWGWSLLMVPWWEWQDGQQQQQQQQRELQSEAAG